jgi:hypothetical protein
MPSLLILPVSSSLNPKGLAERGSSRSDILVDGVRAGAKRLGRKKERLAGSPLPQQPRTYAFHPASVSKHYTSDFSLLK